MLWMSSNTSRAFAPKFSVRSRRQEDFGGIGDGARLFVDFFLHEVAVWAQLQRSERQLGYFDFALGFGTGFVNQFVDAVRAQYGDVAVFQIGDAAGEGDDGGYVGGNEGFLVAQCHQERAAHACDHHFFRFVLRHHGDGVRAVETGGSGADGFKQFAAVLGVFVIDAVGNDFGVGLRFEGVA